jgi:tetratricopeptide (TPR) repeat protein
LRLRASGFAFESEFDKAEAYIERLIELEPDNIEWRRFHLSIDHGRDVTLQELLDRCEEWIESYDGDGRYHMLKASILAGAGHRDRARDLACGAAQRGASNRDVLQQMVSLLDILQLFDEAEKLIRATIEENPEEFWPHEAMVRRYWQQGRLHDALETVEQVQTERGALSISLLQWKSLLHVLRQELDDAEEALSLLAQKAEQETERRDPIRAWIQAAHARIRMQQEEWRDTLSAYRTAISLDPQNPTLHFLIGEAYSQVGEFELALHALEQAVRNDPNWIAAHIMYIEALLRTGRYRDAARNASILLQRSERPALHLHLLSSIKI